MLASTDLGPIDHLLDASRAESYAFVERLRREWAVGTNRFDRPGEAFFHAWNTDRLVGVCGLNRDPYTDDPAVGRIRRLYVLPAHRRSGVGRSLVSAVCAHARLTYGLLRLRTDTPQASDFYVSCGFSPVDPTTGATHAMPLERGGDA